MISESVATCWANKIAASDIGKASFDTAWMQTFISPTSKLDTTTVAPVFPILERKLGPYKPIKVEMTFRDIDINFHKSMPFSLEREEHDITANYTLGVNILETELNYNNGEEPVFTGEFPVINTFYAYTSRDKLYLSIKDMKLDHSKADLPEYEPTVNHLDLDESE